MGPKRIARAWRSVLEVGAPWILRGWWLLHVARFHLRRRDYQSARARVHRAAARWNGRAHCSPERLARAVGIAARARVEAIKCLERSLVLEAMLRAQGQHAEQRFGVRRADGELQAHAWVETEVGAIGERPDRLGSLAPLEGANRL